MNAKWLTQQWFQPQPAIAGLLFAPLAGVYWLLSGLHRLSHRIGLSKAYTPSIPVITVGNIIAGGAGKTPVVMALVKTCHRQRIKVAVISRGYGVDIANSDSPLVVTPDMVAQAMEALPDEPALIASQAHVNVYCHPQRRVAVEQAAADGANLIIADDGLQHYALESTVRVLIHPPSPYRYGNGWLLPVGPLRQLPTLVKADYQLQDQRFVMADEDAAAELSLIGYTYRPVEWVSLGDLTRRRAVDAFAQQSAVAFAGIAYPERFKQQLIELGVQLTSFVAYPDHYRLNKAELSSWLESSLPVLITAKDAVKVSTALRRYFPDRSPENTPFWLLSMEADLPSAFITSLLSDLQLSPPVTQEVHDVL